MDDEYKTLNEVMKEAKQCGLRTRRDKEWSAKGIEKLMRQTILYGERYRNFDNTHLPAYRKTPETKILEKDKWEILQKKLKEKSTTRTKIEKKEIYYLLGNCIRCLDCNSNFEVRNGRNDGKVVGKYSCKCARRRGILKDELENVVIEYAEKFIRKVLSDHTEEFMHLYKKEQVRHVAKKIERNNSMLKTENQILIQKTDKWLKASGNKKRSYRYELIKQKEVIDELNKELQRLVEEKEQQEVFYQRMVKNKSWFQQHSTFSKVKDKKELKEGLSDFIEKVEVKNINEITMTFKHPFTQYKEVISTES